MSLLIPGVASAALLWALYRRRSEFLELHGVTALSQALTSSHSPFAAALAVVHHASQALGTPRACVTLLVCDEGSLSSGYVVRGDAPAPSGPGAMELLPQPALQPGSSLRLRQGNGEPVQRLHFSLLTPGSSLLLGELVVLVPESSRPPPAALRLLREVLSGTEQELAAALGPRVGSASAQQGQQQQQQCPSLPATPVEPPQWSWDVFAGLPLGSGHCPDFVAEQERQYALALGQRPAPRSQGTVAAGEARLHSAVMEMLGGSRTAALLGPQLQLRPEALADFVGRARQYYHANPFHNYYHAVSVLHAAWVLACTPAVAARLQPLDTLALLLGALGHDLNHPGHSNALERTMATPTAMLHNDASILERHHCSLLASILAGSGLLASLAPAQAASLRALLIQAVLHTDLAGHDGMMRELDGLAARGSAGAGAGAAAVAGAGAAVALPPTPSATAQQDSALLVAALLHAADLGGQAYCQRAVQLNWVARIRAEFRAQAALEAALALPASPHMLGMDSEAKFAASQVFFLTKVATPLWQRLHSILGGLQEPVDSLLAITAEFQLRAAAGAV